MLNRLCWPQMDLDFALRVDMTILGHRTNILLSEKKLKPRKTDIWMPCLTSKFQSNVMEINKQRKNFCLTGISKPTHTDVVHLWRLTTPKIFGIDLENQICKLSTLIWVKILNFKIAKYFPSICPCHHFSFKMN